MTVRPLLARLLFAVITALTLLGCSPSGQEGQESKTLKVAFFRDNTTLVSLDPFQVYWLEHRVVLRNVAESLTDQNPQTGTIIPWLAERWDVSENALEYTFHLRKDVTFSNGTRFDAQAVKTAYDSNKAFAAQLPATFGATYLKGYDHAEVVDDFTVKLVLATPNAGFLQATSTTNLAILAPESYTLSVKERSLGAIIGTGPFVLERYTPESGLRLIKRKGLCMAIGQCAEQGRGASGCGRGQLRSGRERAQRPVRSGPGGHPLATQPVFRSGPEPVQIQGRDYPEPLAARAGPEYVPQHARQSHPR